MSDASTSGGMSLQLLEVVEVTSLNHGGAGWRKSPCPDLERARGR